MSLWGKLTGEFIDIVEWVDDNPDVMVHRFERYQNEIKIGAKLTVREGQLAVLVNEGEIGRGQLADVFLPGMHTLTTQNMPILSTLKGWSYGFNSPFKAEVYFFKTTQFTGLKWGTPGPVTMRDQEFGAVRVTAHGIYSVRIKDPKSMLVELVGTKNEFSTQDIEENLRGKIGTHIKEVMPEIGVPVLDLESKVVLVGNRIQEKISDDFIKFGLELVEVQVQDIGLPEELEKAIDQQGAMKAIGNLNQFAQYQAGQAIRDAAQNSGMAGNMMGVGVGGMLAGSMPNLFQQSPVTSAPPPLPGAISFFVALDGNQAGPFDIQAIKELISSGKLFADGLVWKQGMSSWAKASDQPELAQLFTNNPPPLPPQA